MTNITFPKIRIKGQGGLGVKFMSKLLAKIAEKQNCNVTLVYNYDAAVRGGKIDADLVLAKDEIDSPIVSHPDLTVDLIDKEVQINGSGKKVEFGPDYEEKAKQDPSVALNVYTLGMLLKLLKLNLQQLNLADILPARNQKQNMAALELGYQHPKLF